MANYKVGSLVKIYCAFTDSEGAAIDPTVVNAGYTTPSGTTTVLEYGTDAAVVKDSEGHYHVDVEVTEAGWWYYRWWSDGTGQASEESRFYVGEVFVKEEAE